MLQLVERRQRGGAKMERAVECLGAHAFREPGGLGRDPGSHFVTAGRNWLWTRTERAGHWPPAHSLAREVGAPCQNPGLGAGAEKTLWETSVSRGETPTAGSHGFI